MTYSFHNSLFPHLWMTIVFLLMINFVIWNLREEKIHFNIVVKLLFYLGLKLRLSLNGFFFFNVDTAGRFVKLGINFIFFIENWSSGEFKEPHGMLWIYFWARLRDICWGCRRPVQSFTYSVHHWTLHFQLSAFTLLSLTHKGFVNVSMYSVKQSLPGNLKRQKIAGWCHLRDLAVFIEFAFSIFF